MKKDDTARFLAEGAMGAWVKGLSTVNAFRDLVTRTIQDVLSRSARGRVRLDRTTIGTDQSETPPGVYIECYISGRLLGHPIVVHVGVWQTDEHDPRLLLYAFAERYEGNKAVHLQIEPQSRKLATYRGGRELFIVLAPAKGMNLREGFALLLAEILKGLPRALPSRSGRRRARPG